MSFKRRESVARLTNDVAISICFFVFVEKEIAAFPAVARNDKVEQDKVEMEWENIRYFEEEPILNFLE